MSEFHIVIPARFASQRLPGKVLLPIQGKPMLQRVYEQALQAGARSIIIAADDEQVMKVAKNFAQDVLLTATTHRSGTERIAEVIEKKKFSDDTIIVNVQSDEPFIPPTAIRQVAEALAENSTADMATLATPIVSSEELYDSNIVKVISDQQNFALYFSRAVIPHKRCDNTLTESDLLTQKLYQRHIGLYAYRVGLIKKYVQWPSCAMEQIEQLEQLRVLYYGGKILVANALQIPPRGIDTKEEWEAANAC